MKRWQSIWLLWMMTRADDTIDQQRRNTEAVRAELTQFVRSVVDPAVEAVHEAEIERLQSTVEEGAGGEDCFRSPQGRLLRSRCCVYFSNIAASLLEAKYGTLRLSRGISMDTLLNTTIWGLDESSSPPVLLERSKPSRNDKVFLVYELMAKWLLAHANDPLALGVGADRVRHVGHIHQLARPLGAARLGRYVASVNIAGISGQLMKCEMATTHTYLVFRADKSSDGRSTRACKDVVVDVTYKQFLVILEWLEGNSTLVAAAEQAGAFREKPNWLVGPDDDVAEVFTENGLRENMELLMRYAFEEKIAEPHTIDTRNNDGEIMTPLREQYRDDRRPWLDPQQLSEMHQMRNTHMMALHRPDIRDRYCGRPNQAIDAQHSALQQGKIAYAGLHINDVRPGPHVEVRINAA